MLTARSLRFALETAVFQVLSLLLHLIPRRWVSTLGRGVGGLYGHLDRKHRAVARRNLESALSEEYDAPTRRRILRETWRQFGRTAAECLVLDRFGLADLDRLVTYEGWEHIEGAYARGKGVLLISGHFGNWELVASLQGARGLPLDLVTRPLDNPGLERLLSRQRSATGNRIHHKRAAVRGMLRTLASGRGVALVIDQNVRGGSRIFVPFFDRLAATTPALALVALRTDAPVVPVFAIPRPGAGYHVVYLPPVPLRRTDDRTQDVYRFTVACTSILEDWIRRYPSCWLWMHDRWKSRPRPDEVPQPTITEEAG